MSKRTLQSLHERDSERLSANWDEENELNSAVKRSVQHDRRDWLNDQIDGGSWWAVGSGYRRAPKEPVQIRNNQGDLVDSEQHADRLAEYFEAIQWKVSLANLYPNESPHMGWTLLINTASLSMQELDEALGSLAVGKAAGADDIPLEFWRVLVKSRDATGK